MTQHAPTIDLFSPLGRDARRDQRVAYRQFLGERDGVPDVERRTLSRREQGMQKFMRPLASLRRLDRELFDAQYDKFDPSKPTSPDMLLLLTLVKINASEAFGVERTYDKAFRRSTIRKDDLELFVLIEETYHTRILLSSTNLYGVDVQARYTPPAALRAFVAGLASTPEFVARPLVMAGEVFSTLGFLSVLFAARRILKDDPELRDAVEERLIDVLIDEIGHITFNRTCLGPAGLAMARKFLSLAALALDNSIPELGALGVTVSWEGAQQLTTSSRLPEEVRRAAFIA